MSARESTKSRLIHANNGDNIDWITRVLRKDRLYLPRFCIILQCHCHSPCQSNSLIPRRIHAHTNTQILSFFSKCYISNVTLSPKQPGWKEETKMGEKQLERNYILIFCDRESVVHWSGWWCVCVFFSAGEPSHNRTTKSHENYSYGLYFSICLFIKLKIHICSAFFWCAHIHCLVIANGTRRCFQGGFVNNKIR